MSKLKVVLLVGGAVVVAGYAFKNRLKIEQHLDTLRYQLIQAEAKLFERDSLWSTDQEMDDLLAPRPETVREHPAAE